MRERGLVVTLTLLLELGAALVIGLGVGFLVGRQYGWGMLA